MLKNPLKNSQNPDQDVDDLQQLNSSSLSTDIQKFPTENQSIV